MAHRSWPHQLHSAWLAAMLELAWIIPFVLCGLLGAIVAAVKSD